jgi:poly(beta-D-mannuronate) lyase
LNAAIKVAKPGDSILLSSTANWQNTNIVFEANGTIDKHIVLAGYPSTVNLTGNSSIAIGGDYLDIINLCFTNGYAKDRATIEFRTKNFLSNNCRVTKCKIDNYSKPVRFEGADSWIIFWGKNNRFDHNYIGDKLNAGCTLIIELNDERSQHNNHLIDSNFFAGRSPLGSNGGETIRIGVSRYSMTSSNTIVKDNLFFHNSGEVEIISVKSCNNQILNNTFYECEGSVVLRHGQSTTVANNIFIGNNKPYTGGVRIIDSGHIVNNNVFIGLAGNRFRSALAVMNAVPHSLPSRYLHVKDAQVNNNLFVGCKSFVFGAGKDVERTLAPSNVAFVSNTIIGKEDVLFLDDNNDGGIKFKNNTTNITITYKDGFKQIKSNVIVPNFDYKDEFKLVKDFSQQNFSKQIDLKQLHWLNFLGTEFKEDDDYHTQGNYSPIEVKQLTKYLSATSVQHDGKILLAAGRYLLTKELVITKHITIQSEGLVEFVNGTDKTIPSFFVIGEGGSLTLIGVTFNANFKDAGDVQAAITTPKDGLLHHYSLTVDKCVFKDFNESGYSPIKGTKNSFADNVTISNSSFSGNAGVCIDYGAEKDDKGIYNVERLLIQNCIFFNNLGPAINVYRGGNDESTTGPSVKINHCVFDNVDNRQQSYVIRLLGAQYASVSNSIFNNSGIGGRSIWFEEYSWDDIKVDYCNFYQSGRVQTFHNKLLGKNIFNIAPKFQSEYKLMNTSPLFKKASDGENIGLK